MATGCGWVWRNSVFGVVLALALTTANAGYYTLTDVGALSDEQPGHGCGSTALGLNDHGQVVGISPDNNFLPMLFVTEANGKNIRSLVPMTHTPSEPAVKKGVAINNAGEIVYASYEGRIIDSNSMQSRVIEHTPLKHFPSGYVLSATAINNRSQVAGTVYGSIFPVFHAFLSTPGQTNIIDIDEAPVDVLFKYGSAINDKGQVAGVREGYCGEFQCGVFLTGENGAGSTYLGTLNSVPYRDGITRVTSINNWRELTGYGQTQKDGPWHAFYSAGGRLVDLGTLGGTRSAANDINDKGVIVGQYVLSSSPRPVLDRAALWTKDARTKAWRGVDLNTLVDPESGWTLTEAVGINEKGQIAANGTHPNIARGACVHAVLLSPCLVRNSAGVCIESGVCKDTDGDGLCDAWEAAGGGIRDESGQVILDLASMGADPYIKDIFVQVDRLVDQAGNEYNLTEGAVTALIQVFRNAPEPINLHLDCGTPCQKHWRGESRSSTWNPQSWTATWVRDPGWGSASALALSAPSILETMGSPVAAVWSSLAPVRQKAFRHAVVGPPLFYKNSCAQTILPSGQGNYPQDGQRLYVASANTLRRNGVVTHQRQNDIALAATFLHELGHNLGLGHGGPVMFYDSEKDDSVWQSGKPGHLSVMNYSWQLGLQRSGRLPFIDYSRFESPTLDEDGKLNEANGIADSRINGYRMKYFCPDGSAKYVTAAATNPIDWNCNGNDREVDIKANINGDYLDKDTCSNKIPGFGRLSHRQEWGNLTFTSGAIGSGYGASVSFPSRRSEIETEGDIRDAIRQGHDFNDDGKVDLDDLALLNSRLNTLTPPVQIFNGGPTAYDRMDINLDGKIDALDARRVVQACDKPRCAK